MTGTTNNSRLRQRLPLDRPDRRAGRTWVAVAVLVLVLSPLLGACASAEDGGNDASEPPDAARWRQTVELVREAADRAERDSVAAAAIFQDRAHDRLHELAQAVDSSSRAAAGRLLEAKAVVEGDLASQQDGPDLGADLGRLVTAGREALVALSVAPPPCAAYPPALVAGLVEPTR
jgi:hypothetical protein